MSNEWGTSRHAEYPSAATTASAAARAAVSRGVGALSDHLTAQETRTRMSTQMALNPSRQVIFFPSA
jgi:hypothetical protein